MEEKDDADQLLNLRPTLEMSVDKESDGVKQVQRRVVDTKYSHTFGLSHGVVNQNGGILVRKSPTHYKGLSKAA